MSQKILADDGVSEIEVFTADEVTARETAAAAAKEAEYKPKLETAETELATAKTALGKRASEFGQFRELHEDVVAKLTVAEKALYDNQLAAAKAQEQRDTDEKDRQTKAIDAAIRAKSGTDEKLFGKLKETYAIIGIDAKTPEEIERKLGMAIGAIQQTEPDLLASVAGLGGGGALPPGDKKDEDKSFADTDKGKAGAKELGLNLEAPKK